MSQPYNDFLNGKVRVAQPFGFKMDRTEIHPSSKLHQPDVIEWAVQRGRALGALSFGLGKTHIQIEIARAIHRKENKPVLFICPLGVKTQFTHIDGPRLGCDIRYIRTTKEADECPTPYHITNYERVRDGGIDVSGYCCVLLDEGSALRSFGSDTTLTFNTLFKNTPYRYVFTATPAPNDYIELLSYAEFLGIMDKSQAKTRFFVRDSEEADNLTLDPKHEHDFWVWLKSWALFLYRPSDLGYPDEGYELPKIHVHWHEVPSELKNKAVRKNREGQTLMFTDASASLQEAAKIKRETLPERLKKAIEILDAHPDDNFLLWHLLEAERKEIERLVPEAVTVFGKQDIDTREENIMGFAELDVNHAMAHFNNLSYSQVYSYEQHVAIAEALDKKKKLPTGFMVVQPQSQFPDVWTDITRMRGLNTSQGQKGAEKHLCPFPFDIPERLISRYSNPGDIVLDPFAGLGTVPLLADKMGRKGVGIELNPQYWNWSVAYGKEQEAQKTLPTLFDLTEIEQ